MHKDDGEWVRQVLAGDASAYENLVDAHKGRVFAQVVGRIGNFSAAEDVVQNAFVEAYVHLKSLQSPEKFGGWLRGISVNLSNKWVQHQRPSVQIETVEDEVSEGKVIALPDEVFEAGEMKDTVLKAVEGLPDIYREVVLLHYMEEMTDPEMAAFLEVPESTVTGRLQVARKRLRDDLMPLVEETLQEKRPTKQLTRKVMSALPLMLYAAVPAQATLIAKLKGSAMIKMFGFLAAGVIGTGVYFGGIATMMDGERGESEMESPQIELVQTSEQSVSEINDEKRFNVAEQKDKNTVQEKALLAYVDSVEKNKNGADEKVEKVEKANFRMKSSPQDSLVKITYSIPESVVPDSAMVQINFYNIPGDLVARPVGSVHKPGNYTAYQTKRGLPDGRYFVMIEVDGIRGATRALKLVWEDRK